MIKIVSKFETQCRQDWENFWRPRLIEIHKGVASFFKKQGLSAEEINKEIDKLRPIKMPWVF
jgi:hypothetical protein